MTKQLTELKEQARIAFEKRDWSAYDLIMVEIEKIQPRKLPADQTMVRRGFGHGNGMYHGIKHRKQ